jgi:formylglycine-generating enzyme required for sulfatase activity
VPPELANHPKFRVVRELGRGGMGVIYLAQHRVMDKPVALKVIRPAVLDNPDALARFHAEVKAAGRLDHQNIARAHDADQAGELHFLVMEFVEGVSLAQLLERKGRLPVAGACQCVRQAALGLQHAFEQGMVHRDIKPQNLMLTPKGVVKVLDFGLARLRSEGAPGTRLTQLDAFMGTPEYVAPEQATDARQADTRADIYSLGCTLYALLTGRPPFQEDTLVKAVMAHIEKEARPPHELRPEVPPELSAVVAKMLAKDPARRYQRPIEVAQALAPFVKAGGKPVAVRGASVSPAVKAAEESGSPFGGLGDTPAPTLPATKAKKGRPAKKPAPVAWWKRPALLAGAWAALALAVGVWLLLGVVFRKGETSADTKKVADGKGVADTKKVADGKGVAGAPPEPLAGDTVTSSLGMKFAWIPPGTFLMGGDRYDDEKPVHRVRISRGFYLGAYPVTQKQWREVMGDNPSRFTGPDRPVEGVSWDDCQAFCKRLNGRDGKSYRLPTEAEWEYACRAGTTTEYYSGDGEAALKKVGWYAGNSNWETHPVGRLEKNAWGLYDMHGNVWQWCQDWYHGPHDGAAAVDPRGPDFGDYRIQRGGSWGSDAENCRAAYRAWDGPASRTDRVGCRVCLDPD